MTTLRPAADAAARTAVAMRTEAIFRASGAFREGHFLLKSGRHGDAYVEKSVIVYGSPMGNSNVHNHKRCPLFLAGHETTSNALTWTWYLLSQNHAARERLHDEIDRVLGQRRATADDLASLPYTRMVLSESMRLYPPAYAIGRMALEDYEVGGVVIPRGCLAVVSPLVTQRDARWFPEPERFAPERWTPQAQAARPKFSYFPFGGGTRMCIGDQFAWTEGMLLLATLAQRWRAELSAGQRVAMKPMITLRTRYGMRMVLRKRQ